MMAFIQNVTIMCQQKVNIRYKTKIQNLICLKCVCPTNTAYTNNCNYHNFFNAGIHF